MNKRNRMIVGLATFLVAVSVGVGIAIAVTLFYHHMPAVGASATLTPNCDPLLATPASVTIGSSGQITFDCGGAAGALAVAGGSVGSYSYCAEYVDVTNVGLRAFLCRWDA
jgi:hypothetical protein